MHAGPAEFDAETYLAGAWGILRGDLVTVRVVFARGLARYIRERTWHPSQKLRDLPDGRVEMTLLVADTLEVRRWILGYGVQAEVVAPEGLAMGRAGTTEHVERIVRGWRRVDRQAEARETRGSRARCLSRRYAAEEGSGRQAAITRFEADPEASFLSPG